MSTEENVKLCEEQVVELSKSTDISIALLRQLPEEKLSSYYNRTAAIASEELAVLLSCGTVGGAVAAIVMFMFSVGDVNSGLIEAGLAVLLGTGAAFNFNGAATNKAIGQEIQADIVEIIEAAKKPPSNGDGELNKDIVPPEFGITSKHGYFGN